ncbi:MAG TPA: IS3 family transposase [Candidatus Paceibacterota bacterium]
MWRGSIGPYRIEFLAYHKCLLLEPDEFNAKLMDWLTWYNTKRVHFAFGNKMTPVQFLLSWKPSEKLAVELPVECKSGWTHTR